MGLEDKYEIKNLKIEKDSEPMNVLRTPEGKYKTKTLYEQLQDDKKTEYDTWCRHSD